MRTQRLLAGLAALLFSISLLGQVGCGGGAECLGGSVACGGVCAELGSDNKNCGVCGNACDPGAACANGVCSFSCPPGQVSCGGKCTDPRVDPGHCGASGDCAGANAGAVCGPGTLCSAGACAVTCQRGLLDCKGRCVDPRSDRAFCGADSDCLGVSAGKVCGAGSVCAAGACAVNCLPGQLSCAGACVDPGADRTFCGATGDCSGGASGSFGQACAAGQVCAGGACALSCQRGLVACGGTCVNPGSDRSHCGASGDCAGQRAGSVCGAGQVCANGSCAVTCPGNQLNCNGVCIDPQSDRAYCGATLDCSGATAGKACAAGQVCASGACALSCQAGLLACNGACVDPASSRVFCGATADCVGPTAGKLCADGQVCNAGQCAASCGAGLVSCGGACVDPKNDPGHCGAKADCAAVNAGAVCTSGQYCAAGVCGTSCAPGQVACSGRCVEPASDRNHCGASGDCSGPGAGVACASDEACLSGACVAAVTPLDLATPFSTDIAGLPFAQASEGASFRPAAIWNGRAAPLPTNAFWEGMVSGGGNERVGFAPYQLKASAAGLGVGLIAVQTTPTVVLIPDQQQFQLGASASPTTHVVSAFDQFSVTMQYSVGAGTMTLPMVMGMPYVTADYAAVTPKLTALGATFSKVNGVTTTPATGTRFTLTLSDNSTWVLYASAPVTFNWNAGALTASAPLSGTLRIANVPSGSTAVLDAHAGAIPRGGKFDVSIGGDVARLHFNFVTTGSGPLLMMAMPHHLPRLQGAVLPGLSYSSMTGTLQAVEASTWNLRIPLSTITWNAPRPIDPARLAAVQAALTADASYDPGAGANSDPYFGGKHLAKLARLSLIADEVGDTASAAALRARLTPLAAKWLGGQNPADNLVYETSWGGLVTVNGLADTGADFGQGIYNDHHYHYGYHLFAAAAVLKANPNAFTAAQRKGLLAMVRDIANPSANDPGFTQLRMFDLFRSHSWAHGLAYPDGGHGSDQESSSEAVNAWYGLQLLGVATGDQRMADLGRLLLALEIDGARTYWQIPAASAIYPAQFAQNARCVGQLFDAQVTFQTFFGAEPWKVYGIQMIPFTPASELLINPTWISDSWTGKMSPAATDAVTAHSGFAGLLYSAHATIDKVTAWNELNVSPTSTQIDDGNSLTNSLWWVATRP